jgi:hypothetical protein
MTKMTAVPKAAVPKAAVPAVPKAAFRRESQAGPAGLYSWTVLWQLGGVPVSTGNKGGSRVACPNSTRKVETITANDNFALAA